MPVLDRLLNEGVLLHFYVVDAKVNIIIDHKMATGEHVVLGRDDFRSDCMMSSKLTTV